MKRYAERQSTQWEHAAEIRQVYGYRDFSDEGPQQEVRAFIAARAWTRTEGPRALFDQSVAWLREQKILLPGREHPGPPSHRDQDRRVRTASTRSSRSAAAAPAPGSPGG